MEDACIIEEHVDLTEMIEGLVCEGFDGSWVCNVGRDGDCISSDSSGGRFRSLPIDIRADYAHAFVGEAFRDGSADSASGAGDHSDSPIKFLQHRSRLHS